MLLVALMMEFSTRKGHSGVGAGRVAVWMRSGIDRVGVWMRCVVGVVRVLV